MIAGGLAGTSPTLFPPRKTMQASLQIAHPTWSGSFTDLEVTITCNFLYFEAFSALFVCVCVACII